MENRTSHAEGQGKDKSFPRYSCAVPLDEYDLLVKVVSTKKLKPTQHDLLTGQFVKHELWERRVVAAWLNLLYAGLDKQTYAPEQGSAISKLSRFTDEVWLPDEWRPCRGGN